jgi:hypothetical protein
MTNKCASLKTLFTASLPVRTLDEPYSLLLLQ